MANPKLMVMMASRALSSVPSKNVNPYGWKGWRDIPDSALPSCPDPTNGLYETDLYKRVQKKRIWYQIPDGVPIYFKGGLSDRIAVYGYVVGLFSLIIYEIYLVITGVAV